MTVVQVHPIAVVGTLRGDPGLLGLLNLHPGVLLVEVKSIGQIDADTFRTMLKTTFMSKLNEESKTAPKPRAPSYRQRWPSCC